MAHPSQLPTNNSSSAYALQILLNRELNTSPTFSPCRLMLAARTPTVAGSPRGTCETNQKLNASLSLLILVQRRSTAPFQSKPQHSRAVCRSSIIIPVRSTLPRNENATLHVLTSQPNQCISQGGPAVARGIRPGCTSHVDQPSQPGAPARTPSRRLGAYCASQWDAGLTCSVCSHAVCRAGPCQARVLRREPPLRNSLLQALPRLVCCSSA